MESLEKQLMFILGVFRFGLLVIKLIWKLEGIIVVEIKWVYFFVQIVLLFQLKGGCSIVSDFQYLKY